MPTPHSGKWLALLALLFVTLAPSARPADAPATIPVSEIKPGMKGVVYTIFEGDQVEKVDLEVIGILNDALGPKQDVILVKLLGDKAEKTGVAAGMSGSPVYFDGKLAGALSLKIGNFTKDAIGGVTPIASMFDVAKSSDVPAMPVRSSAANVSEGGTSGAMAAMPVSVGTGQFLIPIETPLISAGLVSGNTGAVQRPTGVLGNCRDGRREIAGFADRPADQARRHDRHGPGARRFFVERRVHGDIGGGGPNLRLRASVVWFWRRGDSDFTRARGDDAGVFAGIHEGNQHGRHDWHFDAGPADGGDGKAGPGASHDSDGPDADNAADREEIPLRRGEKSATTPLLVALASFNGIVGTPAYARRVDDSARWHHRHEGPQYGAHRRFVRADRCADPDGFLRRDGGAGSLFAHLIRIRTRFRRSVTSICM